MKDVNETRLHETEAKTKVFEPRPRPNLSFESEAKTTFEAEVAWIT